MNYISFTNIGNILSKQCIVDLDSILFEKYKNEWKNRILAQGIGKNLHTYKLFKSYYGTKGYLSCNIPYKDRSALAKLRCGVAPLRIETARFESKMVEIFISFVIILLRMKNMLYYQAHYMQIYDSIHTVKHVKLI